MSRIGKKEIIIPENVQVTLEESELGTLVKVKGPKGELEKLIRPEIAITLEDKIKLKLTVAKETKQSAAFYGLSRTLVNNMIVGVTVGFSKELEIQGVGYRAALQGANINFQLGKSHPELLEPPAGISFEVEKTGLGIKVAGADKELVGQIAATIRSLRPVEVYKGKGIRYKGEHVRKKAGKSGGK
ncbi:MAG: 50S ribosomal protein L6 [Candidatus Caenarcaniphilales bacterium]|nr:50S ribosomal protein L6 [Candidatus Caenarcaniphilales bacterium]